MNVSVFAVTIAAFALSFTAAVSAQSSVDASVPGGTPPAAASTRSLSPFQAGLLADEAQSSSQSVQQDVLNWIDRLIKSNPGAARTPAIYRALSDLALSGTGHPIIEGSTIVNDFPLIRMQASRDLGELGGSAALTPLLQVLHYDRDPVVLAEVSYQLGRLGKNPNNEVIDAISRSLLHVSTRPADAVFAYSALASLGRLEGTSATADQSIYNDVSTIRRMGFGSTVRQEASKLLSGLLNAG